MLVIDQTGLMQLTHAFLQPRIAAMSGTLAVAHDPWHVYEILSQSPAGFLCVLAWEGEDTVGDRDSGIVRQKLYTVVTHNRGLHAEPGKNLFLKGERSLTALAGSVRDHLRAAELPDEATSRLFAYTGTAPFTTPEGLPIDALRSDFSILTALPAVEPVRIAEWHQYPIPAVPE
jgi:hypothetical protein